MPPAKKKVAAAAAQEKADKPTRRKGGFARQAESDMRYPRRVIKELLRDVNLLSISPVCMFDSARLWQSGLPAGDGRYAGGVGLRFSLINLDLTAGYSWTIGTKPGEGRGALLLNFGVSNLFR